MKELEINLEDSYLIKMSLHNRIAILRDRIDFNEELLLDTDYEDYRRNYLNMIQSDKDEIHKLLNLYEKFGVSHE